MGDPVTMAAMQVAKGVAEYSEKSAQEARQQDRFNRNRIAATQARDLKVQSLNQRMIQEAEAAADQKQLTAIQAMELSSRAKVAAGEAGLSGSSVDMVINDYEARKLRGIQTINTNVANAEKQLELQKLGASAEAENRINAIRQGQQPSFLAAAVGTAANAYGAYKQYSVAETPQYQSTFAPSNSTVFTDGSAVFGITEGEFGMADDE